VEVVFADNELVRSACTTSTRADRSPTRAAKEVVPGDRPPLPQPLPLGGEDGLPFSKGLMARALIAAGISADRAYELALALEADIAQSERQSISLERLEELAHESLGAEDGADAMRRLRRYQDLYDLDLPIILLVGGATGTGKSTVATDVAYRLGITRVTSTDFVRQTMRAFFSREFMPAIHYSSFEAGRATADEDDDGERGRARRLPRADARRARRRGRVDRPRPAGRVVDGARRRPSRPGNAPADRECARRPVRACYQRHGGACEPLLDPRQRLGGHAPYEKYLECFDDIRLVQEYILGRAQRHEVPVIQNANLEEAVVEVMELVLNAAEPLQVRG
jgi:2-phosphoglycerate kinase